MQLPLKRIQWVEFHEHPISHPKHVKVELFEIYSKGLEQSPEQQQSFNHPLYCRLLLDRVLSLNSAYLSRFLNYQCELLKRPYSWLTSLDMLLEFNVDLMKEIKLVEELRSAMNLVNEKRMEYQKIPRFYREDDFEVDNPYRYDLIKSHLDKLKTHHKKKAYLLRMKTDYLQNLYDYDRGDGVDFDVKIDLELAYLDSIQKMRNEKDFELEAKSIFLVWEGPLNVLVDFYYQCLNYKTENNRPMLSATKREIENFIVKHYRKPDGSEFNATTIRTILTPSRNEKRPNEDKRISLEKIIKKDEEKRS